MKNPISEFLQSSIEAKNFPSVAYLVAEKGEIVFQDALGLAVIEPEEIEARIDTIYDLASLTKVLVTGLLCAKAIEDNEINLKDKISEYFDEFKTNEKCEITIEHLLTHTSGFPAWKPFYLEEDSRGNHEPINFWESNKAINKFVLGKIGETPIENSIGSKVVYSDLNFLTLGFLIEKIYATDLQNLYVSEVVAPLRLKRTFIGGHDTLKKEIAASEFGNEYEKQICVAQGYDVSKYHWRDYQIWGEVHDGNCYFMRGVSGHAGLFSDAAEVFKIAQQFLENQTVILKPETCHLFRTNLTKGLNEARSVAFQLAATPESTASNALAENSFGHLGFTGTSLWIEPETERIFILLTNRTHARALPFANINSVRRIFHELAAEELNKL